MTAIRRARQKGFSLLLLALVSIVLVPMVGLAIDASILYVVKARISAACDAASLAAARNLSVGQTMAQQAASARDRAQSFFYANFPANYLGATPNAPNIDIPTTTPNQVLTVTTTATATVNTYFMRMLGRDHVTVSAAGAASRRDVNLMLVLDRSASMSISGACGPMKTAAANFVNKFVDGRDKIGVIHFGTNTVYAFPIASNFKSATTNANSIINGLSCQDSTSIASAYWEAYQKLVTLNQPGALNVIVVFTDGIPNGINANFPVRTSADMRYGSPGPGNTNTGSTSSVAASSCSSSAAISGVVSAAGDLDATGDTKGIWAATAAAGGSYTQSLVSRSNCAYRGGVSGGNTSSIRRDLQYIPDTDVYSNKIRNYSHQYLSFNDPADYAPGFPTNIRIDRPRTITIASSNLLDHAAQRVRTGTLGVVTFAIGLGAVDGTLLKRVANDPSSPIYVDNPDLPDGKFILASNTEEMNGAFNRIASEVLRLSR